MIVLKPISINNVKLTKAIFDTRYSTRKAALNEKFVYIKNDYREYYRHRYSLEKLVPDKHVTSLQKVLHACYDDSTEFDTIKQKIYDNVPNLNDKCLYCELSEADTLDHYINKAEYPEFSIFTDNLIPCCSKCNRKKQAWKNGDKRLIFNNYFDNLVTDEYLFVDIGFSKDIPFIKDVRLDFNGVKAEQEQIELIKRHFDELDLIERYKKPARSSLNKLVESIKNKKKRRKLSTEDIIEDIESEIDTFEDCFGKNHWEAAVYKGVLKNNDLLVWLSK